MKKFIVSFLLLLPFVLSAQEVKIAIVNTNEVFNLMPETTVLENEMSALMSQLQTTMKEMQDEYNRKMTDLQAKGDSLTENIRNLRIQEITQLDERMQNFVPMAEEEREKKYNELLAPIQEKMLKAIRDVGDENGYTCIVNPQVLLYTGKVIDATEKVKAKLGLK